MNIKTDSANIDAKDGKLSFSDISQACEDGGVGFAKIDIFHAEQVFEMVIFDRVYYFE